MQRKNEPAANYEVEAALREALFGNGAEARHRIDSALGHSMGREVQVRSRISTRIDRGFTRAQALADDLDKNFPEDTIVRFIYLPTLTRRLRLAITTRRRPLRFFKLPLHTNWVIR